VWRPLLLALALLPGLAAPTAAQGAGASPSGAVAPPGPSAESVKQLADVASADAAGLAAPRLPGKGSRPMKLEPPVVKV